MIELYRMLHGLEKIDSTKFVTISQGERTRGSSLKLYKKRCRLDVRKYFFSQRVVNVWNSLPESVVCAPSVASFKARLDKFWKGNDVGLQELFGSN